MPDMERKHNHTQTFFKGKIIAPKQKKIQITMIERFNPASLPTSYIVRL